MCSSLDALRAAVFLGLSGSFHVVFLAASIQTNPKLRRNKNELLKELLFSPAGCSHMHRELRMLQGSIVGIMNGVMNSGLVQAKDAACLTRLTLADTLGPNSAQAQGGLILNVW